MKKKIEEKKLIIDHWLNDHWRRKSKMKFQKLKSEKSKNFQSPKNVQKCSKCPEIIESSAAVIVSMYWMIHSIEWSLKKKIINEISNIFHKFSKCPEITESAAAAVVWMYWTTHSIEWSLKKKIKTEISKNWSLKNQKNFKKCSKYF